MSQVLRSALLAATQANDFEQRRTLRQLRRLASAGREEYRAFQRPLLAELLASARETSFYGGRWPASKAAPQDPFRALAELPVISKQELKEHGEAMVNRRLPGKLHVNRSGGSTGEPVSFYHDARYRSRNRATVRFFDEMLGWHAGDRRGVVWGSERDLLVGRETLTFRAKRLIKNEHLYNCFQLDAGASQHIVDELVRWRPKLLYGYASGLYTLTTFCPGPHDLGPQLTAVVTAASTLTEEMRGRIRAAFGRPVVNHYGSREFGPIARECLAGRGLHIAPTSSVVEILDDHGEPCEPGVVGEITVTGLACLHQPLVRYRTGDLAALVDEPCECGMAWPRLTALSGRISERLRLPSGRVIPSEAVIHLVGVTANRGEVRFFQLKQTAPDAACLQVVVPEEIERDPVAFANLERRLLEPLHTLLCNEMTLHVEAVHHLQPAKSGKYRYVVPLEPTV